MSMYSTEINGVIGYSNILSFKGKHHARAEQFVVILKKISDYWDPQFYFFSG